MAVPKYVGIYFSAGIRTKKETVMKRFKELEKSRWGYKTTEYKQLKRYLKTLNRRK